MSASMPAGAAPRSRPRPLSAGRRGREPDRLLRSAEPAQPLRSLEGAQRDDVERAHGELGAGLLARQDRLVEQSARLVQLVATQVPDQEVVGHVGAMRQELVRDLQRRAGLAVGVGRDHEAGRAESRERLRPLGVELDGPPEHSAGARRVLGRDPIGVEVRRPQPQQVAPEAQQHLGVPGIEPGGLLEERPRLPHAALQLVPEPEPAPGPGE
jgi:hypothetical protein